MPEKKPRLPDALINKTAEWIEQGAPFPKALVETAKPERDRTAVTEKDRQWSSFRPLAAVRPPEASAADPIDWFRAAKGLALAQVTFRRTLICRAKLDLT